MRYLLSITACMRMRKLGNGQSLVFLGSPEVEKSIRSCLTEREKEHLDSASVVR
jgi:hypothetical protein